MKKCLLKAIPNLAIIAYEQEKETACLTLDEYYKLNQLPDKIEWLRKYGDAVCEDILYESELKDHKLKLDDNLTDLGPTYDITWGELKKFLGSNIYNVYVSFIFEDTTIEKIIMVPKYEDSQFCFSVPLLKSLGNKYAEDGSTVFHFRFANINQNAVIVIQVAGSSYYDYSTDPKEIPTPNIPL